MERPFLIAEIGINHNGDINIAKKLILMAKKAGCDSVKFQKRTIDKVYSKEELDQKRESPWGTTFREQKEGLEFGLKEYEEIDSFCRQNKIEWFASAWDLESLEFLKNFNLKYNKIASAMITNIKFLEAVASQGKYTFISTGMSNLEDIKKAVNIFKSKKCPFELMHCISVYPCPEEILNLHLINFLKKEFNCKVGYSGHESSVTPSIVACTFGISSLERHITLDRSMYGSDQSASLEYVGLLNLINSIKKIPIIIGSDEKKMFKEEMTIAKKLRYWEKKK
jgi:N-acetylneuraminate synthase